MRERLIVSIKFLLRKISALKVRAESSVQFNRN